MMPKSLAPARDRSEMVTDLPAYSRRRAYDRVLRAVPRSPVEEAVLDAELRSDAKLLVASWLALQGVAGPDRATLLDAVTLATGLRGYAALSWVAVAIVDDADGGAEPALPRYIDVDWPRMHSSATGYVRDAEADTGAAGTALGGAPVVSVHGYP
jgi:hypothetical protein